MKRRELVLLLTGAMATPRALRAQQKVMPVIGFLSSRSPFESEPLVAAFRRGLSEAGFVEGRNTAIEYHWAENRYDRLPGLAARLVSRHVAVIVAAGGVPAAVAARRSGIGASRPLPHVPVKVS